MSATGMEHAQLIAENEALRAQLAEATATLDAIRRGEVDAIIVAGPAGDQVYTLSDADRIYRTLIEEMNEGALTVARDGMILYANRRFAELVKAPLSRVIGSALQRWLAPDSQAELAALLSSQEQARRRTELALAASTGAQIPVMLSANRLTVDGAPDAFCVVIGDLSEQKATELRLAEQAALLDQAHDAIMTRSLDGNILFWNRGAERTYGWTASEAEGKVTHRLLQTVFPDSLAALDEALFTAGEWEGELMHTRRDGVQIVVASRQVLQRDLSGSPVSILEINRDITARKRTERALAESQAMYRLLAEHSSDAVSLIEPDGTVKYVSPAYLRRMGYAESELLHLDAAAVLEFIHPDDRAHVAAEIARGRALKLPTSRIEYRCLTKPGDYLWLEDVLQRDYDAEGNLISVIINSREVTDRKRAETERDRLRAQLATAQRLEVVGRLAGGIAHEFNNLLAVIMLRTQLLLMAAPSAAPLHNGLEIIYSTAKRSADLVQSLLGYARRQVAMPEVLDLNSAVATSLPILQKLAGEDIWLRWQPVAELRPVQIDPAQLDQILVNLCVNARDAIAGRGAITLAAANCTIAEAADYAGLAVDPGDYTLLTVADTGSGIAPDVLPHIFDPFFTTKEVGKGSGLGLSAVDGIVRQNGGFIQVASQPGAGATFKIYLKSIDETSAALAPTPAGQLPHGHGETVLLVEDEASVLQMASEALEFLGYVVIAAPSPSAALAALEAHDGAIDLLLVDVVMPEMNGAELAARIAALQPGVRRLFVSGYPADVVQQRMHLAANAHYLQKPFSLQSLAVQVRAALTADRGG